MAGGITTRSGSSNSEVTAVKMVSGGSVTDVTQVWSVSGGTATQIFPESQFTVSGSITDSVTNGSVSATSYSFGGVAGATPDSMTITVTADDDHRFTNANSVTITENPSVSFVTTGKTINADRTVITITISVTIQSSSRVVDLTLSGTATQNTYTSSGNITGTVSDADYTPKTWSVQGIAGKTESGSTVVEPDVDYEFNSANDVTVTTTPTGISGVTKTLNSNGTITIAWTETVQKGGSTGNIVITGSASESNNTPTVSLVASDVTPYTTQTVTLTASATDADNDTISYTWDVQSGSGCSVTQANSNTRTVTKSSPGTCVYRVTVSDGQATASDTVSVTWSYPPFTCSDWTGSFQVSISGVVTVANLGNVQTVQNITENCGNNSNGCSNTTCQVTSYQLVLPSGINYSNAGSTVTCNTSADYKTLTQGFGGTNWTSSNWTGSVSVSGNGTINLTQGNATSISSSPSSYSNNNTCSSVQRNPAITLGVPTGFCNSGTITYIPTLFQPANKANWGSGDWTGSVSVNSSGTISCNAGNAQSCTVLTSNFSANNTCDSITRTGIQVRVVAPSGECNAGSNITVSGLSASQPQSNSSEYFFSTWNGTFSVNSGGTVTCTSGNSSGCSTSPSSFAANTGCNNISRTATATITVPSGYCNTGGTVSGSVTALQPSSGANFTSDLWTGSCSADSSGNVSCTAGNVSSVTVLFETCSGNSGCSDNTCTATVRLNGIPSGYCNSGGNINSYFINDVPQAAGGTNLTCATINFSVDVPASGNYTTSYNTSVVSGTPSFSPSSFGTVSTNTFRTVTGTFTPTSTYCNSDSTVTCYASDTQPATPAATCSNYTFRTFGFFALFQYTSCAGSSLQVGVSGSDQTRCVRDGTTPQVISGSGVAFDNGTNCTS